MNCGTKLDATPVAEKRNMPVNEPEFVPVNETKTTPLSTLLSLVLMCSLLALGSYQLALDSRGQSMCMMGTGIKLDGFSVREASV